MWFFVLRTGGDSPRHFSFPVTIILLADLW